MNDIAVARDGALVMWDEGNGRLNFYNPDGTYRTSARNQDDLPTIVRMRVEPGF